METWKINDGENGSFSDIMENLNKDNAKGFLTDIANFLEKLIEYLGKLFTTFTVKPKYADKD